MRVQFSFVKMQKFGSFFALCVAALVVQAQGQQVSAGVIYIYTIRSPCTEIAMTMTFHVTIYLNALHFLNE